MARTALTRTPAHPLDTGQRPREPLQAQLGLRLDHLCRRLCLWDRVRPRNDKSLGGVSLCRAAALHGSTRHTAQGRLTRLLCCTIHHRTPTRASCGRTSAERCVTVGAFRTASDWPAGCIVRGHFQAELLSSSTHAYSTLSSSVSLHGCCPFSAVLYFSRCAGPYRPLSCTPRGSSLARLTSSKGNANQYKLITTFGLCRVTDSRLPTLQN